MNSNIVKVEIRLARAFSKDQRGWVIDPVHPVYQNKTLKNLHIVNVPPGDIRGNHLHNFKSEYICVLGSGLFFYKDLNGKVRQKKINKTSPVIIKIPAKTAHSFKNNSHEEAFLLCYSDKEFDPKNPDIEKRPIT